MFPQGSSLSRAPCCSHKIEHISWEEKGATGPASLYSEGLRGSVCSQDNSDCYDVKNPKSNKDIVHDLFLGPH